MVCNQPTRWQLTLQSQADAVWRQSTELSPSLAYKLKKMAGDPGRTERQKIWGQSVVGLDPNCSIHGVLSHQLNHLRPWTVVARLFCSWNFSRHDTVVGCHFLLPRKLPLPGSPKDWTHNSSISYISRQLYHGAIWEATITHCTTVKSLLCASESSHVKSCCTMALHEIMSVNRQPESR